MGMTKTQLVRAIADRLGVIAPPMSTGAKEPKAILVMAADHLGLDISPGTSKPKTARAICEAAGVTWTHKCEARGYTVTNLGLQRVLEAVVSLTDPP